MTLRLMMAMIALAGLTASTLADEAYFRTPSKNIYCAYFDYDGRPEVRCDIRSFTSTMGKAPPDCDLEWGDAFVIGANDKKGSVICHGDTVISDQARILAYGQAWKGDGITCMSQEAGLTCINRKGHGFTLSKSQQKIF